MILSAEMGKISKSSIKRIVNSNSNVKISDSAAESIARILEGKAQKIAKFAVKRAKEKSRGTVLEEDIDTYMMKFGD